MASKNMYQLSVKQWNPFVGCHFDCSYCKPSFQAQAKRQKHNCMECYDFRPHIHPKRLTEKLPETGYMQFIFACASGDVSFCDVASFRFIVQRMREEPSKTFLLQSKNPKTFHRIKDWPENVILGTTIETNRKDLASGASLAPEPIRRAVALGQIKCARKMVTIEPIMDFDSGLILNLIDEVNPCMVWMGFNSKRASLQLPEPSLEKFRDLHWRLAALGIPVILKHIPTVFRKAGKQ